MYTKKYVFCISIFAVYSYSAFAVFRTPKSGRSLELAI